MHKINKYLETNFIFKLLKTNLSSKKYLKNIFKNSNVQNKIL